MSTRERVLERLRQGDEVSGEALAVELGVSRVAVGKHIAALRSEGYVIEAVPGSGYRLVELSDAPLPAEVSRLVTRRLWRRFEGGGVTGSTNDDARALARAAAEEGTVVTASRQTAGRGRLGRSWESPSGGAYVSVVLRPPVAPADLGPLALVIALGIARGLGTLGVSVELKWPNDVLLGGRKLAGVLLEMTAESDRVDWVIAGFGINVRRGDSALPEAAYLSDVAPEVGVVAAVAASLDGIADAYAEWLTQGFAPLAAEYRERSSLIGHAVVVRSMDRVIRANGVVVGVDDEGRLLVEGPGGMDAVSAGEVTLRD